MSDKMKVMLYGEKSYIKTNRYGTYRANGFELEPAPGDPDWRVFKGEVVSIELRQETRGPMIGWKRKEGAPSALPETLPVSAFDYDCDDGEWRSETGFDHSYFESVYPDPIVEWVSVPFEVIDRNCEPVRMERWAKVTWPSNVERYPEQQHKYPCYIEPKDLFPLVANAIIAHVKAHPGEFQIDNYLSIGTLTVKKVIQIPKSIQEPEMINTATWGSKRKRMRQIVRTEKTEEILKYNGFYNNHSADEIRAPQIQGDNYADLVAKVDQHIAEMVAICDPNRWCVCEQCGGAGICEQLNNH